MSFPLEGLHTKEPSASVWARWIYEQAASCEHSEALVTGPGRSRRGYGIFTELYINTDCDFTACLNGRDKHRANKRCGSDRRGSKLCRLKETIGRVSAL